MRKNLTLIAATAAVLAVAAAACSNASAPQDGPAITGVLTSASGSDAPLIVANNSFGNDFAMSVTLGSSNLAVSNQSWQCYGPDIANGINQFDIVGTDNSTFLLHAALLPQVWSTGAHPIDGVNVSLDVSLTDRFGISTSGTLTLLRADKTGDQPGNFCAFSLANIQLYGHRKQGSPP